MLTRRVAQLGVRFVRTSAPACSRENQGESGNSANQNNDNFPDVVTDPSSLPPWEIWRRRLELRKPILQRDEKPVQKVYHAPEFFHDFNEKLKGQRIPKITELGMTPEKWEHYNKVVWPPNYVVPETGLPKTKEVFHCRESVHHQPKRMFKVCKFVNKMMVDEAIAQCKIRALKGTLMMAEILEEAKKRASSEFNIEYPSTMYVADAFAIQSEIVKGAKRHAHEVWHVHRYRYVHVFVRLEEGPPPPTAYRYPMPNGWEKMKKYVDYLHNRTVKYGL